MKAQETLIDVTANNLANVNTNGFKRSQVDFADLMYDTQRQAGSEIESGRPSPIGLQIGSGVRPVGTTKLFTPGTIEKTGQSTDVAILGDGFFRVTVAGEDRYTRDGAFRTDASGTLVTTEGYLVDGGITVDPNAVDISIGADGTITGLVDGQQSTFGQISLTRFANPAGLSNQGNNLYAVTEASGDAQQGLPADPGFGQLQGSHLERSNVEVVTELIGLITAQRAYEVNSRAIRAGDEMLSTTTDIVR